MQRIKSGEIISPSGPRYDQNELGNPAAYKRDRVFMKKNLSVSQAAHSSLKHKNSAGSTTIEKLKYYQFYLENAQKAIDMMIVQSQDA